MMGSLVSRFPALVFHLVYVRQRNIVPDHLSWWPDYLYTLTTTTTILELFDCLHIIQEHNTTLQKYWLLAYSTHADYGILHNSMGKFLTFKGRLYIPKKMVLTIFV